jgi:hypothetical protein
MNLFVLLLPPPGGRPASIETPAASALQNNSALTKLRPMNAYPPRVTRRTFSKTTLLTGAALASGTLGALPAEPALRRIRTGVIGCGSVSNSYLPVLTQCPFCRGCQPVRHPSREGQEAGRTVQGRA